ncbi:glycosyltransferase 61 family protein [Salipiger bermudensis]|uniref:glycosyltransferase 61 family protein n=1 Tax=Salipiger bermudensis TaxID=344736 RepID=UPI001CD496FC|nr:glycosyltransferase 61 family protein [Salipiger bermudensis]MCA0964724.1 glycosyltransferase family 61 protein [Salipiger bermudensis]
MAKTPPPPDTRKNVLLLPYDRRYWGGPNHFQIPAHGRVYKFGEAKCRFRKAWQDTPPERILEGRYLYGGPLKVHFGHMLVDTIVRLYAFDPAIHRGVVFPKVEGFAVQDWVRQIIGLFGIDKQQLFILDRPTQIEELDFARPASGLGEGPKPWYLSYLRRKAKDWALPRHKVPEGGFPKDIFLGRTHILHKGSLMGESWIEEALNNSGFASVTPEKYGIRQQMAMLRNARRVVFTEGSSVYPIELLNSSSASFYMIPRRQNGANLFRPHIEPRGPFHQLGDDMSLRRLPNFKGKITADSASVISRPETIHEAMVRLGLVPDTPFDAEVFEAAVQADVSAHTRGDAKRVEALLEQINR